MQHSMPSFVILGPCSFKEKVCLFNHAIQKIQLPEYFIPNITLGQLKHVIIVP